MLYQEPVTIPNFAGVIIYSQLRLPVRFLTVDNRYRCLWTVNNSGIIDIEYDSPPVVVTKFMGNHFI